MDDFESDRKSLMPQRNIDRRQVLTVSLAAGFAAAVRPIAAETAITTDTNGLEAGEVPIPVSDGDLPAYRAMPAGGGPFPVVLVVQEIFGVHEHMRDVCRRLAKQGYMAIAPELYARQGDVSSMTDVKEIIAKVVSRVPDAQVMSDLDAVVAYAGASGRGDTARLGITGFCWGGRITWLYAAHNPALKAGVAWYGRLVGEAGALTPRHPVDLAQELKAPVRGLYGGADQGIPIDTIERMRGACKAAQKTCEIIVYPDAPHAFHADYRPSYRPDAARDGWARMLAWFHAYGVA
jgi:carboxymethylenebutenolidase